MVQTCGGACERKHSLSVLIGFGIWAGFLSAMVRSGVETLLPPRPPGAVPPPIGLLNLMGFDAGSMNYAFNQAAVNWGGNGVHILFSMVMAFVYVRLMEVCSKVGIWWGLPFAWLTVTIRRPWHCVSLAGYRSAALAHRRRCLYLGIFWYSALDLDHRVYASRTAAQGLRRRQGGCPAVSLCARGRNPPPGDGAACTAAQ